MRDFDEYGLRICKFQGKIFEMSRERAACSSPVFLRRFMLSGLAVRMDRKGFLEEAASPESALEELNEAYGTTAYGKIKYGKEELYWIGYIYRYWSYTREVSSKQIYKMAKPKELRDLYYPYHSLDPTQAIARIMEAKGLKEADDIQRGVELMRRLKAYQEFLSH